MNAVVETTTTEKVIRIPRVTTRITLSVDEDEAMILKTALEYLRSPTLFGEEAVELRDWAPDLITGLSSVFETAGVYTDGFYPES